MSIKITANNTCFIFLFFLLLGNSLFAQENSADTEKAVYFFGPSNSESDSLTENDLDAIDDFNYYAAKVIPFLKQNNIKSKYLSDRNIVIKYDIDSSINVNRDSINFGTILTDWKNNPKILKYVLTDDELKEEIIKYYKLKITITIIE